MKPLAFFLSLVAAAPAFAEPPANLPQRVVIPRCESCVTRKIDTIIIPRVDFRNVTVVEAIEFLRKKSQELDPSGEGVNIILMLPNDSAREKKR